MQFNFLKNKVTILTEAGKNIGFGHYTRCSSIYKELLSNHFEVQLIVFQNECVLNDSAVISFNWLEKIEKLDIRSDNEIVLVDSYLASELHYKKLQGKFKTVIVIDDYNRIVYPVKYILNPNVFFENMDYSNQNAECTGGKDYVILRPEFRFSSTIRFKKQSINQVLITIGGSDFRNILPTIIKSLFDIPDISITIIDPEATLKDLNKNNIRILPSQSSAEIFFEMQQADIVISACGQTLHELVALNKPTIGICLDIDQILNQKFYLSHKFLRIPISWNDKNFSKKIRQSVIYFMTRKNRINPKATKELINKNGVCNVVNFINKIINENI